MSSESIDCHQYVIDHIEIKLIQFIKMQFFSKQQSCQFYHMDAPCECRVRWNDKIIALEKDDVIPFLFNENQFSFFVANHLLVGQLCTNPKCNRSLLSCLKAKQCSMSEIGQLYNSCTLLIQVMTTGPLPAPSKCKSGLPRITGTCPGWWKQSFWLRLWSLVWFQVRATSCHLTSSKSAWKSTPKCTCMCWRVWWSPGAIRWLVAGPGVAAGLGAGPQVQRDPGLALEGVLRLCTLLSLPPPPPLTWTRRTTLFGHTSRTSPTWPLTTPKPAWLMPSTEYSPSFHRRL